MQKKFCDMTTLRIPADASSGRTPCKVLLPLFVLCLAVFSLCGCTGSLPGSEDITATVTPQISPSSAPTLTPTPTQAMTPTPTQSARPTPVDISGFTNGGCNACAVWNDDDTLKSAAEVKVGSMIYANNFERDRGNRLASGNTCNDVEVYTTDTIASSGLYSYKITRRLQDYHGMSGLGFRLDERNGLSYESLVGKTIRIDCRIYYADEGFGVADELTFALYDGYRTERVYDYVYEKVNGGIQYDKKGRPVRETKDAFPLVDTYPVRIRQWTSCTFYIHIDELPAVSEDDKDAKDPKDGFLLLATLNEEHNSIGLYCSYYLDDLTITVVPDEEAPVKHYRKPVPQKPDYILKDNFVVLIPEKEAEETTSEETTPAE